MLQVDARVLIVDDNATDRLLLKSMLHKAGLRFIQEAENGRVGAQKMLTAAQVDQEFDLVFVDLNMPLMNGLNLVRKLRSQPETKNAKIVMLTATSDRETVSEAMTEGIDDFIVKPFQPDTIEKKIANLLNLNAKK